MRYQPLTVTVKGVWLYLCSHKWLMETRLISRCKKVVIVVMVVSTFIVVASATRAITARCFWGNKEVKAREEHPVEPDGFYTSDRLFSLQAAISLINRLSLYLYLHLTFYFSPSLPSNAVRHLYFPRSRRPSSSPPHTISPLPTPPLHRQWLYFPHSRTPHTSIGFTAVVLSGGGNSAC